MFEGFYVEVIYTSPFTQEELLTKEQLVSIREIMLKFVSPEKVPGDTVINQSFLTSRKPLKAHYIDEDIPLKKRSRVLSAHAGVSLWLV